MMASIWRATSTPFAERSPNLAAATLHMGALVPWCLLLGHGFFMLGVPQHKMIVRHRHAGVARVEVCRRMVNGERQALHLRPGFVVVHVL